MSVERESAVYVNYCHQCDRALSSARTERCERCAWLRCECGACGCNYDAGSVRPLLVTLPPVWAGAPSRHVASFPDDARSSRPLPLLAGALAVVLVATAVAVGSQVIGQSAEAPGPPPGGAVQPEAVAPVAPAAVAPVAPAAIAPVLTAAPAPSPPSAASVETAPAPAEAAQAAATAVVASAPSVPAVLYVANTDGQGAYIRTQPRDGADTRIFAWNDGTPLVPLETRSVRDGAAAATWVRVRDPRGQEGWLRQTYLASSR